MELLVIPGGNQFCLKLLSSATLLLLIYVKTLLYFFLQVSQAFRILPCPPTSLLSYCLTGFDHNDVFVGIVVVVVVIILSYRFGAICHCC